MTTAEIAAPHEEARVTPLELFFDLVFVFALTQVTAMLADEPTWTRIAEGVLVLGALWWAWVAYAWLTNYLNADEGAIRIAMFGAMAAMLIASLATPGAFDGAALTFGIAFFAVRVLHIVLYAAGSHEVDLTMAVRRLAPTVVIGSGLIIAAAALDGWPQLAVWAFALTLDYVGPALGRGRGWRVSPGHFAERHGLIVIIALGESIVALGVGAAGLPVDVSLIAAAVIGLTLAAVMWWAYFDIDALVAERKLRQAEGVARATMARDAYSYLHLAIVGGIVLVALGIKKTLGHVGDPLDAVPALALGGGVALYLLGHFGFRWRTTHTLHRLRLAVAVACLALVPVATEIPSIASLSILTGLMVGVIAYERIHLATFRARVRASH